MLKYGILVTTLPHYDMMKEQIFEQIFKQDKIYKSDKEYFMYFDIDLNVWLVFELI